MHKQFNKYLVTFTFIIFCVYTLFFPNYKSYHEKPQVTATTTFIGDIVNQLAGDYVEVNTIMGPGIDPHNYQASPSDLNLITHADLVLFQGLNLEGKLSEVLADAEIDVPIIEVTKDVPREDLIVVYQDGDEVQYDPHVWFDPHIWQIVTSTVEQELVRILPQQSQSIIRNSLDYQEQIIKTANEAKDLIGQIPEDKRILISTHDAFSYYGRFLGLEVYPIQGVSTASEASPSTINEVVNIISEHNIPTIYVENATSPQLMQTIKSTLSLENKYVNIGPALYTDSLGDTEETNTYTKMFLYNTQIVTQGLGA